MSLQATNRAHRIIWLHIGVHKTGTTSIQTALARHRDLLRTHGVYVPKAGTVDRCSGHHAIAWAASSAIAGIAGVLFALVYDLSPAMFHLGLKSFPATILGGLDSVIGSGFGGILIGVVENLAGGYIGSGMKDIAGFLMIIIVLMVQPFGLFGEREIVRV